MVDKAITSEVDYLVVTGLGYRDIEGTTVALRTLVHQSMVCFVSSGEEPAIDLMRHLAGYIQVFFNRNDFEHKGLPYTNQTNLGSWLITLDLSVKRLEESVQNSARGDSIGHLMTIMSILKGCMEQHGVEQRAGFEVE